MDRLFLDANILFSAAYRAKAGLLVFWKLKSVVLCSSRYAVEEARINLDEEAQRRRLDELSRGWYFSMRFRGSFPTESPCLKRMSPFSLRHWRPGRPT